MFYLFFFHSSYPDGRPKRQLSGVTNPNNKDSQDTELKKF